MLKAGVRFAKGVAVVFAATLALVVLSRSGPLVGALTAAAIASAAVVALVRPLPECWLEARATCITLLVLSLPIFMGQLRALTPEKRAEQRIEHARLEAHEAERQRRAALRSADPQAYLQELLSQSDPTYLSELAELDRPAYEQFMALRAQTAAAERQGEIKALKAKLAKLEPDAIAHALELTTRLAELEGGKVYATKIAVLRQRLDEQRARMQQLVEQRSNPHRFVKMADYEWRIDGFGTVMIADFKIKNGLPWAVKDITVTCHHSGESGTQLDSNTRTIYQRIEASKTKWIKNFNMGFINHQAARSGCYITSAVVD